MPPSSVANTKMSTPAAVNVGAVPPAQSTDAGKLTVWLPPFVNTSEKTHNSSDAVGFENVKVSKEAYIPAIIFSIFLGIIMYGLSDKIYN